MFYKLLSLVLDERGDDYGEKAVILGLVVLVGIGAWAAFGQRVVQMIQQVTAGM